jgi:hypothetical protein
METAMMPTIERIVYAVANPAAATAPSPRSRAFASQLGGSERRL